MCGRLYYKQEVNKLTSFSATCIVMRLRGSSRTTVFVMASSVRVLGTDTPGMGVLVFGTPSWA